MSDPNRLNERAGVDNSIDAERDRSVVVIGDDHFVITTAAARFRRRHVLVVLVVDLALLALLALLGARGRQVTRPSRICGARLLRVLLRRVPRGRLLGGGRFLVRLL